MCEADGIFIQILEDYCFALLLYVCVLLCDVIGEGGDSYAGSNLFV